ncbi:hypothetical protein CW751_12880 [Brumimicrobium salinarum]|uniref:Uncharacterized protein n=1 Tax=Brumimicrobium salinarum TaxID=2058658 RepID=A0A2I0QZS7_9FLAO|nr:hypothetical protein [Brumimicrobium salinarum]PKR79846.1 hypothetical protein CW751_12880 [Brumimicrobium salinarum]
MKNDFFTSFVMFLLSLCLGVSLNVNGQLLNNKTGEAFTDRPYFNEEIIRKNKIKTISGGFIHYKLGDILRETDYFREYTFNEKGQLVRQLESRQVANGQDTLVSLYEYDNGNLVALRQKDQYGFYAYIYAYDEKNRVINEEYRRNLNRNEISATNFKLGREFSVSAEKSSYEDYDGQQKRTIYNSYGIPYKHVFTYYDDLGLVTSKVERLIRTSDTKTTFYSYNEKNLIDSIKVRSNSPNFQNKTYVFEYDDYENLVKKEVFKNDDFITQYQVIYHDETMLINDVLIQNIATNFIMVLELRNYTFFD